MMNERKPAWQLYTIITVIWVLLAVIVGWVVHDDWGIERITQTDHVMPVHDVGNLLQDDLVVEQLFSTPYEELSSITFWPHLTEGALGQLTVEIVQNDQIVAQKEIDITELRDYVPYAWECNVPITPNKKATLRFSATQEKQGYCSVFYGDTVDVAGRFQIAAFGLDDLKVSGNPLNGRVAFD